MGRAQEQVRVGPYNTLRGVKRSTVDENGVHGCLYVKDNRLASGMEIRTLYESGAVANI